MKTNKSKKLILGLISSKFGPQKLFLQVLPLLDIMHCYKLSLYPICRKTNEPNLKKQQKT